MYKEGDFVVVKEGFEGIERNSFNYPGHGYCNIHKNKKIRIKKIIFDVCFFDYRESGAIHGVYKHVLKTMAEIRNEKLSELLNN